MFELSSSGSFDNLERFLKKASSGSLFSALEKYGQLGVDALAASTPMESGETAASWYYEIIQNGSEFSIIWGNSHVNDGVVIAVILQHGHGTGTGGYVPGRDYINPAIGPVMERAAAEGWKVVIQS